MAGCTGAADGLLVGGPASWLTVTDLGGVAAVDLHRAAPLSGKAHPRSLDGDSGRIGIMGTRDRQEQCDRERLKLRRRKLRVAHVLVEQEPRRKGRRGRLEAEAFQNEASRTLERNRAWPKLKAPLAVDFHFSTSERQPPKLWSLPKHYLDLLGSGLPNAPQQPLLFGDDRQVKMLYVSAHHGWEPDAEGRPWLAMSARTRTDALHVMELADRLSRRRGAAPLGWDDDPARDDLDLSRENLDTAARLEERGDDVSLRTAELMRHQVRRNRQEQLLRGNDEWLTSIFLRDARRLLLGPNRVDDRPYGRWSTYGLSEQDQVLFARQTLRGLYSLELPPLPSARGGSAEFRSEIERICAEFVAARPGLFPLVEPLRVTVLVVPPAPHHANTADLDNILIRILSTVDEQMKPPLNPWLTSPPPPRGMIIAGEDALDRHERGLARAKSLGQTAIWAYQVFELARTPEDPAAGQVTLVLGHGMNHQSVWAQAARYADDHIDDHDDSWY